MPNTGHYRMKPKRVKEILAAIKCVKIAVLGDFCLDAYWMLDPRGSELSVETGLRGNAVARQQYSLGGASNVVANLAALGPASINAIGAVGAGMFGRELIQQLQALGVETGNLIAQEENFDTVVFCKPHLSGKEQPRVDFGFYNRRSESTDHALICGLRAALETADAVVLNQQVPGSITNESFIDSVNELLDEFTHKIVLLDSRHYGARFTNVYRKTNDIEAARLNGIDVSPGDVLAAPDIEGFARDLYRQADKPVFVSRGARGILVYDGDGLYEEPGIQLMNETDPVGAGDTALSALACCLAAGVGARESAQFANFAGTVTVQKLFQTGTASGDEIVEVAGNADYIYQPELAEDIRQAHHHGESEVELCCDIQSVSCGRISHAVFDHDGTISTLRQGWETVMEPVMVKAILGDKYSTADGTLYHKARNRVSDYIDKSTGIQTILQMESLVEMVKEFSIVPRAEVLDKFGYKKIYNDALMELVSGRTAKLRRGELDVDDYVMKGVLPFLDGLREKGVTLYLASGTDRDDVAAEAEALGYAGLFDGGIYGAVGDVSKYSKKMVIENILRENGLRGAELACFGDGPVEIRECRKHDGIAVGIAGDEIRRHGLDVTKRTRLVKAGAHIIAPDFSQGHVLMDLLFRA